MVLDGCGGYPAPSLTRRHGRGCGLADSEQLELLNQGVESWNDWRRLGFSSQADLSGAELSGADLTWANLNRADLRGADLRGAVLTGADLGGADLRGADLIGARLNKTNLNRAILGGAILGVAILTGADLSGANLREANLRGADLTGATLVRTDLTGADLRGVNLAGADLGEATLVRADLTGADLTRADLSRADLTSANLTQATLVSTVLENAALSGSLVFGTSVWRIRGTPRVETDLVITDDNEPTLTVDNLEVAQFMYLLLHSETIRDVIDTVTSNVVLILGRFTDERKAVLDALRDELRVRNLSPILFDFDPSSNQDIADTVTLLARMARFVIADLTDPRSVQQELTLIAPEVMVAIRPIILAGHEPWIMFDDLQRRSQGLLPVHRYRDKDDLLDGLTEHVIEPVEAKRSELLPATAAT